MTISYSTGFYQIIFRWRGSIWRSNYKSLSKFIILFYLIKLIHVIILYADTENQSGMKDLFENLCRQFHNFGNQIPITFLLGFYVNSVVSRWWSQFECLTWPEDLISLLCVSVKGTDERSARVREQVVRYTNVAYVLVWRDISDQIRSIFPSVRDIVKIGLLTEAEYEQLMEDTDDVPHTRWLTPLHWSQQIMTAENTDFGMPDSYLTNFVAELKNLRNSFRKVYSYDWITVPLVYTQVATIATHGFFFFALFGRQRFEGHEVDCVFPIFTVVQFIFFFAWLQVGLDLMKPFGMDDDDIELSYILERNLNISFAMINRLTRRDPPQNEEDLLFDSNLPIRLQPIVEKLKQKSRPPKLNTFESSLESSFNEYPGSFADRRVRFHIDNESGVIREEPRPQSSRILNHLQSIMKEDKPKEKRFLFW